MSLFCGGPSQSTRSLYVLSESCCHFDTAYVVLFVTFCEYYEATRDRRRIGLCEHQGGEKSGLGVCPAGRLVSQDTQTCIWTNLKLPLRKGNSYRFICLIVSLLNSGYLNRYSEGK